MVAALQNGAQQKYMAMTPGYTAGYGKRMFSTTVEVETAAKAEPMAEKIT